MPGYKVPANQVTVVVKLTKDLEVGDIIIPGLGLVSSNSFDEFSMLSGKVIGIEPTSGGFFGVSVKFDGSQYGYVDFYATFNLYGDWETQVVTAAGDVNLKGLS